MAEETPQPVNPAVNPQVEDPPATAVPVAQIDRTPAPVSPATNPEVPQASGDLPAPIVYPAPETPTQDPIVVAQASAGTATDTTAGVQSSPATITVPVTDIGFTPIGPAVDTPAAVRLDPNAPVDSTPGVTRVTAQPISPREDPNTLLLDETGTISTIQRNPETGELFSTGEAPRQLPQAQLRREAEAATNTTGNPAPSTPAPPPASQVQATPPATTAQDYGASSDAAALERAQQAEAEAFRQGRIPRPITQDPQVTAPADAPPANTVDTAPRPVTNPPNPQVPVTDGTTSGPGITGPVDGISPYGEADDPQISDPRIVRAPTPITSQAPDGTTAGPGITGPVDGISPYGEANDPLAVGDGTTAGRGITGPVDGISPYGEADDPREVAGVGQPGPASGQDYGSSYDAFQLEQAAARERVDFENGRIPRPVISDPQAVGLTESEVIPEYTADPRAAGENVEAVRDQALRNNVRNQQAINAQRGNLRNSADWRVRLSLAPSANYLYNAPNPGILAPLSSQSGTNGVIFPYTPSIQTVHKANYNSYDLTHSNYRGYFYQGSQVEDINITATFTAQDTVEAEYLLAVIHFFRSVTKMFYGQDATFRGAPPPLVFLSGLGEFQYVNAPCVVASFNYNLPTNVDYIRARSPNQSAINLLRRRQRQDLPAFLSFSPALQRLYQARLRKGGDPRIEGENVGSVLDPPTLGLNSPTYVPTMIEMTIILHPVQSRRQVSQDFSLREYSNGSLITRGFW